MGKDVVWFNGHFNLLNFSIFTFLHVGCVAQLMVKNCSDMDHLKC